MSALAISCLWCLGAFAVLTMLVGVVLPLGPAKAMAKLFANSLMGVLMLGYGASQAWGIAHAARKSAGGTVANLAMYRGKGSHSDFSLMGPDGPIALHAHYTGSNLADGEQLVVRYVQGFGTVTHLEVMDGPNAGWTDDENDGTVGAGIVCCVGLLLVPIALWNQHRFPDGRSPRRRYLAW